MGKNGPFCEIDRCREPIVTVFRASSGTSPTGHRKQFLLKFARDRRAWVRWLYEARKRFGLCVLNYLVTSNRAHVLVVDRGRDEIAASLQLVAGRTAQDFNRRKARRGAFWEDRYHATAVDTDEHLARCLVYIDLNMVRAGVVEHPRQWGEAGYHEIQRAREAYRIIDRAALSARNRASVRTPFRARNASSERRNGAPSGLDVNDLNHLRWSDVSIR